jgi:hypothetical protein
MGTTHRNGYNKGLQNIYEIISPVQSDRLNTNSTIDPP